MSASQPCHPHSRGSVSPDIVLGTLLAAIAAKAATVAARGSEIERARGLTTP